MGLETIPTGAPKTPGEAPEEKSVTLMKKLIEEERRKESLTETENLFDKARNEFWDSAPDFREINKCIAEIKEKIEQYNASFGIILHEEPRHGGGLEENRERIENMKNAIPELKAKIEEAESIINSNESVFGSYKGQIDAAKKIIGALEKI